MNGDKPASRQASLCRIAVLQISRALRDSDVVALFMLSSRSPVSPRLSWAKNTGFLQFAEKFLHCMRNKVVWISC
jgi:hypothetical protein